MSNLSLKPYQCTKCGQEQEKSTNHYGEIYPWCDVCGEPTTWKFTGEVPEGGWVPEPWTEDMKKWAKDQQNKEES